MANATVEKLKALGLRQGEKVVVGLAATVLLVAVGVLATTPRIDTTPDELAKKATDADSNLQRKQEPDAIVTRIEEAGIKDPGFTKLVENQASNTLKPDDFRVRLDWVTPEPGAGLIRDQPELIAPTELVSFPGRGGALLYALDEKGERILDKSATALVGRAAVPATGKAAEPAKQKQLRSIVGKADDSKPKVDPNAPQVTTPDPAVEGPFKEETIGKRWVVVTAVIDNETLNKNWLAALKNPAIAFPQYLKVDAERQALLPDGTWSAWTVLDENAKYRVLDNMPEKETELIPEPMILETLVDPLPFLRAGYWTGVHIARLVPAELRNEPVPDQNPNLVGMRSGGRGKMGMLSMMGMESSGNMQNSMMNEGMSGRGSMMSGMSEGMESAGMAEEAVVPHTEPTLMIRSIDFTVEPNTTYRYQIRLVVKNPNFERSDVNPGVDTTNKSLVGPWSPPTDSVGVPADVSIYALNAAQATRRDDVINFRVFRWVAGTGQTVANNDEAGPGFLVGENSSVQMPASDGSGAKSETVDFNSRSVVLDSTGGTSRIPDLGGDRINFTVPAVAMVIEPDGGVVIRNQSRDTLDEVRQDMESNYKKAVDESTKKRDPTNGMMNPGGLPGTPN